MQNFQYIFETRKRSFISAFSICMTLPLSSPKFLAILVFFKVPLSFLCVNVFSQNNEDTEAATCKCST